jgi:hypothetical protein
VIIPFAGTDLCDLRLQRKRRAQEMQALEVIGVSSSDDDGGLASVT